MITGIIRLLLLPAIPGNKSCGLRLELAYRKGCYYIVEQPVSSLLFCYKPLRRLLKRHGAIRVTCALGAYHAPTLKQVSWLQHASLVCKRDVCCRWHWPKNTRLSFSMNLVRFSRKIWPNQRIVIVHFVPAKRASGLRSSSGLGDSPIPFRFGSATISFQEALGHFHLLISKFVWTFARAVHWFAGKGIVYIVFAWEIYSPRKYYVVLNLCRSQLRKVRSFLKLETTKVYIDGKGRKRCVRAPCAVCALVYPNCQNTARPFKGKMFNFTLFRDIPIILPARDVPKKTPWSFPSIYHLRPVAVTFEQLRVIQVD